MLQASLQMAHTSNISRLPPPACTWYSSRTFLTLKIARLRCLQRLDRITQSYSVMTSERHAPLEQPQNWHVIFIFNSRLRQHSLAN